MKVIGDGEIAAYLVEQLTRKSLLEVYMPLLVEGLRNYENHPDGLPERTVRASATPGSDSTHLFMPCILAHTIGVKVISGGPSNSRKNLGFQGSISVLDDYTGELEAVLNAKTITAFRTALASSIGMVKVFPPDKENEEKVGGKKVGGKKAGGEKDGGEKDGGEKEGGEKEGGEKEGGEMEGGWKEEGENERNRKEMVVFGAGPQSFWHVIITAKLYRLSKVTVVSRNVQSALKLAQDIQPYLDVDVVALGVDDSMVKPSVHTSSIIFGCTPSTDGIIRDEYISKDGSHKYVSLIGSYKPHMYEMDLEFMKAQYADGTKILVDSVSYCLSEAGELIQPKISSSQLVPLSKLDSLDLADAVTESGVVLSKIVGLSVMDIVIAKHLSREIKGTETDFD